MRPSSCGFGFSCGCVFSCGGCGHSVCIGCAHTCLLYTSLAKCPVIIDADGINNLAMDISIVSDAKCPVILTPHFGEMARICRTSVAEIQKAPVLCAQELAAQLKSIILLKGAHTIIASPDGRTFINQTGNPGLAKAGSGDVLTGILASLVSQGMEPFDAAVCAAYLHGAAADRCVQRLSEYYMQPDDILKDLSLIHI